MGQQEIAQFLSSHREEGCTSKAINDINEVASVGHLDVVKWLCANRPRACKTTVARNAVLGGHLRMVQVLMPHQNVVLEC